MDKVSEYDSAHAAFWPELLRELKGAGISQYSIFRLGAQLFFYLHVENFEQAWRKVSETEVDRRWQEKMAPFLEPPDGLELAGHSTMMLELFYLE